MTSTAKFSFRAADFPGRRLKVVWPNSTPSRPAPFRAVNWINCVSVRFFSLSYNSSYTPHYRGQPRRPFHSVFFSLVYRRDRCFLFTPNGKKKKKKKKRVGRADLLQPPPLLKEFRRELGGRNGVTHERLPPFSFNVLTCLQVERSLLRGVCFDENRRGREEKVDVASARPHL